jgi:predicted acylesterase/phospholipase RssA
MATKNVAIACQGGGSHAAFTAGVLPTLMTQFDNLRAAQSADQRERKSEPVPNLVGLSGTSGGAISALLGWHGFITGGAPEAQRQLDLFWSKNSTTRPGEYWMNLLAREMGKYSSYFADLKYSPYTVPLEPLEWYFTRIWPHIVTDANPFMRPDYFQLEELLAPCIHFGLVEAVGAFASIPSEASRWMECELQASLFPANSSSQLGCAEAQAHLAQRITDHVAAAQAIEQYIDDLDAPADALLRVALQHWTDPPVHFDMASLARLSAAVKEVTRFIPTLLIGAVELRHGGFTTFSSECAPDNGGITIDSVMASAALPWLVRARRVRHVEPTTGEEKWRSYWDGLFSQNPPIKNFLHGLTDERKRPDKIWIVQISPHESGAQPGRRRDFPDRFLEAGAIWEVRNTLAGNISLNQEVSFVEAINKRIAEGGATEKEDKPVQIDRIILDGDAVAQASGMSLGPNSKMDRSDRLKDALVEHGQQQATRFLSLRSDLGRLFKNLDSMLGAQSEAPIEEPAALQGTVWVEELVLHRLGEPLPYSAQATIRWRAMDAKVNGTSVRLEGEGELVSEANTGAGWTLKAVTITCMERLEEAPAPRAFAPFPQPPVVASLDLRKAGRTGRPLH